MKRLLLAVVLSAVPYGLCYALDATARVESAEQTEPVAAEAKAQVWVSDNGTVTVGQGDGNAFLYTVSTDDRDGDGRSESSVKAKAKAKAKTVRVERIGSDGRRAWLGVSIDEVPDVLADQLETGDEGVVIVNVVKDSPADRAGLRAHDVLLSVGGETVTDGPRGAVRLVSSREPGDDVKLVVLRDGKENAFTVTLASAEEVEAGNLEWTVEVVPEGEIEDEVKTRGRLLFRGPQGEWITKELDELDELKTLPDSVRMFLPRSGHRVMTFSGKDGEKHLEVKVQRDGTTIIVERKGEGGITVTRVDEDGNETVDTYATPEDLEAADEEAYRLYKRSGNAAVFQFNVDGIADLPAFDGTFDFDFEWDDAEWKEHMDEWNQDLDQSQGEARQAYQAAMQQFHEAMKELQDEHDLPPAAFFKAAPLGRGTGPHFMHRLARPRHTFEVRTDGTIEVRIRKGDSELIRLFDGEDDLANRAPDLYEKYEKLIYHEPQE